MEQSLDDIAEGKANYRAVIGTAHDQLSKEVQGFTKATGKVCPKCGKSMRHMVKKGAYDFWGCSGYPDCRHTEDSGNGEKKPLPMSNNNGKGGMIAR